MLIMASESIKTAINLRTLFHEDSVARILPNRAKPQTKQEDLYLFPTNEPIFWAVRNSFHLIVLHFHAKTFRWNELDSTLSAQTSLQLRIHQMKTSLAPKSAAVQSGNRCLLWCLGLRTFVPIVARFPVASRPCTEP